MKTKEELKILKTEYETLSAKLCQLTEDELALVTGGYSMKQKLLPQELPLDEDGIPWQRLGVKPSSKTVE